MPILKSMSDALNKNSQLKQPTLSTTTPNITSTSENMAQNVSNNLNANSVLMKTAAASGERQAAARGLQNSSIGIESAQRAMINAAMPIAQIDTQNQFTSQQAGLDREHQRGMTQLQADLNYSNQSKLANLQHQNEMDQLNAQVAANTIGKSIDFAQQITNNFDAQIAGILQNTNMKEADKQKAITQLKASRDSELRFMSSFFQAIPTTKQRWSSFPNLGVPSITIG
ncbi:hypothetical protein [Gallibacterium sp. AGMB14963]|uniref:hypothetical protein n=1 Tax=Gallibacterium faecale TaxID=3019086 RepID=UPI0022F1D0F8|nr:hypothetical protein [Gallibacterium sp. AGMB14963]MDA3978587.1 hypothetical protein [Gallibacterium sp. AGMB14963]